LVRVARLLLGATRGTDSVARYGGDEFVVIAPDADLAGAVQLAERCRSAVESAEWSMRPTTVSVGVATWVHGASTSELDSLPLAADNSLYHAKRNGRNRVTHAAATE
jgi:diguanylate cyclase (GGDEF)-like protein